MIVLDASALIDVVIDQPWRAGVLEHFEERILAPAHQPAEVLSALARLARAGAITPDVARLALDEVADLGQELIVPDRRALRRALELGERIRVLDGLYVALAEQSECVLLTTDRRLASSDPPCRVLLVGPDGTASG